MKLDGYIRVSRVNGREGDNFISPDVQRDQIERWAQLRGVDIVAWHTDLDESGGKLSRPNFDRALARVQSGKTGGIAVAKLDRFSRAGVADALKLIESIEEAGGQVASVAEGVDPTTPFGEFARTIFLALARMQRQQIAANWREAQRRAVERGVHVSSMPPTGYRRAIVGTSRKGDPVYGPLEPVPEYRDHIAEIFRMKADGASWRDLADYLRAHSVESPYGTTDWQPRALTHVIANRAYLGEARSGEFTNPNAHEPIVDEATWQAAQEAKGERPVNGMGGSLLAGLLRCDGCGYVLKPDTMSQRGVKRRLYRCRTHRSSGRCPAPATVLGSVIEPFVVEALMAGVGGMRATGSTLTAALREAEREADRADAELASYLTAVSASDVGADAFAAGARQRREVVDRAQAALYDLRERAGVADLPRETELRADWSDMPVSDQNAVLRAAFDAIVIRRGRESIDEKTTIFWKGTAPTDTLRGRGHLRAVAA